MSPNKKFRYSDLAKETPFFPRKLIVNWESKPDDIIVPEKSSKTRIDLEKELEQARQLILECLQEQEQKQKRKRGEDTEEDTE